jgi:asparagine synthase (glutamine-hydrolysing)
MCGIAGIMNIADAPPVDSGSLERMIAMLRHRGPDGKGFFRDGPVGLAHARLSIIDLAGGAQPIHNEDKTVWVVFNGEIFNYVELRADLESKGHHFYTKTDTEVLVHLYEEYGDSFPAQLNGQFAIALWDTRLRRLVLVRDRAGILPLFYRVTDGRLHFASEVKGLLAGIGKSPRLDPVALDQLMTFWAPLSPRSIFEGVHEVRPGEMLTVEDGAVGSARYWDWSFPANGMFREGSPGELAEELRELLVDATRIRLRSDVPVGAYLSGGLDSSALVSLIHHHSDARLRTFSIGFEDRGLDETGYQDEMVEHLGTDHSRILCTRGEVADSFLETIWHTETPVLRTAPVPMGLLSGLVQMQGYKVVLTGEGSDEVLGGYDIFKEAKIRDFWARRPESQLRPLLLKRLYPYLETSQGQALPYLKSFFGAALDQPDLSYFSHVPRWITTAKCKQFFSADFKAGLAEEATEAFEASLPEGFEAWHSFDRAQYIEARGLMCGYLLSSQGDRMLMSHSVEGRFPYLDHRVIEFANSLDPRLKMKVLNEKYLLKRAMRQYLPPSVTQRYKQPYRAPDIAAFFSDRTPDYVYDLLGAETVRRYGYFDAAKVQRLLRKIEKGRAIGVKDNMAFVGILSTQAWHHLFCETGALWRKSPRPEHGRRPDTINEAGALT